MARFAAGFVKEINDGAGNAASQDDEKTKGTDENGCRFWYSAKAVQHDLQNFFPKSNSGETDWQRRDRAFYRHHRKKIDQRHLGAQGVSSAQKGGECGQMRDHGRSKGHKCRAPVPRIKVIGSRDFDQFFPAREFLRQKVNKIKSRDYKRSKQAHD